MSIIHLYPFQQRMCIPNFIFLADFQNAYAGLKVHADRTPWCMADGEMVHRHRQDGAWWPWGLVHGHHVEVLLNNALALSHGLAFNLNGIRIINDPVADGVSQI